MGVRKCLKLGRLGKLTIVLSIVQVVDASVENETGLSLLPCSLQACRLTNTYDSLRNLGHKVRERPFGFQSSSAAELDSFLLYSSSLRLKARIVCLPVSSGFVCLVFGFLTVVALTLLQVISALPTY
jgi:hypothetical protein